MKPEHAPKKAVVRKLIFVGSGTRPIRSVETLNLKYGVLVAGDEARSNDHQPHEGCIFYRPGCPCGVPF